MKTITKALICAGILLAVMNVQVVRAEPSALVVPGQYWSDGAYRSTLIKWFYDNQYSPYEGHTRCMIAARVLHAMKNQPTPAYSMCAHPESINKGIFR